LFEIETSSDRFVKRFFPGQERDLSLDGAEAQAETGQYLTATRTCRVQPEIDPPETRIISRWRFP
jgi:hypothetical protein